jgi:hypothetical protein
MTRCSGKPSTALRVHVRICWPGLITRFSVAPANAHELSVVPELLESTRGLAVGDRNYHSPETREELAHSTAVELLAPYRSKTRDPAPERSAFLSRFRYRIDTVFSELTERYCIKRVWAKDLWHLAGRLLRKVLSHTVAFLLNHRSGNGTLVHGGQSWHDAAARRHPSAGSKCGAEPLERDPHYDSPYGPITVLNSKLDVVLTRVGPRGGGRSRPRWHHTRDSPAWNAGTRAMMKARAALEQAEGPPRVIVKISNTYGGTRGAVPLSRWHGSV